MVWTWSERAPDLDLGDDHALWYTCWKPDRKLNPQYAGIPDTEKWGAIVAHRKSDGVECWSGVTFKTPTWIQLIERQLGDVRNVAWDVVSWEPLTLSPSLLCTLCKDHGWIREGKWVRA